MNETWQIIIAIVTIGAFVFGAVWIIIHEVKSSMTKYIEDVKKSAHARIDRCDHAIDQAVNGKYDFITTKAFDRFDHNIGRRLDGMQDQMKTTNSRIDDTNKNISSLVLTLKNGGVK